LLQKRLDKANLSRTALTVKEKTSYASRSSDMFEAWRKRATPSAK